MLICLIISFLFLALRCLDLWLWITKRKQVHTLIQICSCFAKRNATALWQCQLSLTFKESSCALRSLGGFEFQNNRYKKPP